jgi:hypothetical protein
MIFIGLVLLLLVVMRHKLSNVSASKTVSQKIDTPTISYPYKRTEHLLTKAERELFIALCLALGKDGLVFSKVRVADLIIPDRGIMDRPEWQTAFNKVAFKHFDFVICNSRDFSVVMAVELDDSSHKRAARQKRDIFLDNACRSAGLPLLRIKASWTYSPDEIRERIFETHRSAKNQQASKNV